MSNLKYPSIPSPSPTLDSIMTTLLAMKENIELLTGQIVGDSTTVATKASLAALQAIGFSQNTSLGNHVGSITDIANNAATAVAVEAASRAAADVVLTNGLATANTTIAANSASVAAFGNNYHITGTLAAGSFSITGAQLASGGVVSPLSYVQADKILLGGASSLFPAIMATGTTLSVQLADGSDDAALSAYTIQTKHIFTVATLPAPVAGIEGLHASVSNALAPAYGATVAGGGAVHVPVYCNGTAWICA